MVKREMRSIVVFSIGGNVISRDNYKNIKTICEKLFIVSSRYKVFVVTGGGDLARNLIKSSNEGIEGLGKVRDTYKPEDKSRVLDELGIMATRLHAQLLASVFLYKRYLDFLPTTIKEAIRIKNHFSIIFMGGTSPGKSTDAVAAELASKVNAKMLVNVNDVGGVYDKDPRKFRDARLIDRMSYDELWDIIKDKAQVPGEYELFDHKALKIVREYNIPVKFISVNDIDRFEEAKGTLISFN